MGGRASGQLLTPNGREGRSRAAVRPAGQSLPRRPVRFPVLCCFPSGGTRFYPVPVLEEMTWVGRDRGGGVGGM